MKTAAGAGPLPKPASTAVCVAHRMVHAYKKTTMLGMIPKTESFGGIFLETAANSSFFAPTERTTEDARWGAMTRSACKPTGPEIS